MAKRKGGGADDEQRPVEPPVPRDEDFIDVRYIVPGLARGLAMLQLFTKARPEQTLNELAEGLGLSRSAAYRLVYTLEKEGFLSRNQHTRRYRVTSRVLSLGFELLNALPLTVKAQPYLLRLSEASRAASHMVVLEGWQSVYLARVAPQVTLVSNLQIGTRLPAHVTASGRIMLAHLDDERLRKVFDLLNRECTIVEPPRDFEEFRATARADRARGHVFRRSVFDRDLVSFAAPVRDGSHTTSAINIVAPKKTMDSLGGEATLRRLVGGAAEELSHELGFRP